jgi:type I restriction enzyme S subunit
MSAKKNKTSEGGEVSPLAPASSSSASPPPVVASATPHEGWSVFSLDDLVVFHSGGTPLTTEPGYWIGTIPWLSAKDMKETRVFDTEDHISVEGLEQSSKLEPTGTIFILTRGMTLLHDVPICIAKVPISFNQDVKALIPKKKISSVFLLYLLKSIKPQLLSIVDLAGHGTGRLNTDSLKKIQVSVPDSEIQQQKIAAILSSLDDKIELNRAMNETLEQIAQALFKSWFVDFDPVRAKAAGLKPVGMDAATAALFPDSFEESELGPIPTGWEVKKLGDIGSIICGKTPPKEISKYYGRDVPFLKIPDMHNRVWAIKTSDGLSNAGADFQKSKYIPIGSICVSCIATVGLVNIAGVVLQTNQQINSIVPNDQILSEYLFFYFLHASKLLHDLASAGSATLNLNTSVFSNINVLLPNISILKSFHCTVGSLFKSIKNNDYQNIELTQIRDSLLPKLLSGEIRVDARAGSV